MKRMTFFISLTTKGNTKSRMKCKRKSESVSIKSQFSMRSTTTET